MDVFNFFLFRRITCKWLKFKIFPSSSAVKIMERKKLLSTWAALKYLLTIWGQVGTPWEPSPKLEVFSGILVNSICSNHTPTFLVIIILKIWIILKLKEFGWAIFTQEEIFVRIQIQSINFWPPGKLTVPILISHFLHCFCFLY